MSTYISSRVLKRRIYRVYFSENQVVEPNVALDWLCRTTIAFLGRELEAEDSTD